MEKEKKEIGKLLELLNEYEKRESGISNARTTNFAFLYYLNNPAPISELNLISKKYGFIKWLVENDKIGLDKLEEKVLKENLIRKFDEGLLMLLSISDNPIDDLVLYLK